MIAANKISKSSGFSHSSTPNSAEIFAFARVHTNTLTHIHTTTDKMETTISSWFVPAHNSDRRWWLCRLSDDAAHIATWVMTVAKEAFNARCQTSPKYTNNNDSKTQRPKKKWRFSKRLKLKCDLLMSFAPSEVSAERERNGGKVISDKSKREHHNSPDAINFQMLLRFKRNDKPMREKKEVKRNSIKRKWKWISRQISQNLQVFLQSIAWLSDDVFDWMLVMSDFNYWFQPKETSAKL